jgi:predicted dehydrogenase
MGREFASAAGRWFHLLDGIVKPQITAVCDMNEDAMKWFTDNLDTVTFTTKDYHELLARTDVDAVYCAVPHNLHGQFYSDIIRAGKHLMGEKPFGVDQKDNEKILQACAEHPEVIVRCASEFPYYPACQKLISWIKEGRFGKILEVRAGINHSSDMDVNKPINWKRIVAINGEYGCMGDLGIHTHHIPLRMGWKPRQVYASLSNIVTERYERTGNKVPCETWDNATVICDMEAPNADTFPVFFEMKRMKPGATNEWYIAVYGLERSAKFTTDDPNAFYYTDSWGREQAWCRLGVGYQPIHPSITASIFEFGFTDAMLQMWYTFMLELVGKKPEFGCFTPEESKISHKILTAALQSYKEKRAVEIDT